MYVVDGLRVHESLQIVGQEDGPGWEADPTPRGQPFGRASFQSPRRAFSAGSLGIASSKPEACVGRDVQSEEVISGLLRRRP